MELLVDLFGYLSVLLRGFVLVAQSFTVGGVAFLMLLAQPLSHRLGADGMDGALVVRRTLRLLTWSALALLVSELLTLAVQASVLMGSLDISITEALSTRFAAAVLAVAAGALAIAVCATWTRPSRRGAVLVPAAVVILLAQVATSHAAARLEARTLLEGAGLVHMAAAAVWLGGLPYFLSALARTTDATAWSLIGHRYSRIAMGAVAALLCAGAVMGVVYIGSVDALYGTAYGVMVVTKVLLIAGMLFFGFMNFALVRRIHDNPPRAVLSLRRFVEAELGIGLTLLFAAGSLTSQPPGVDLTADRASWQQVVEQLAPTWPRLDSPALDSLAIAQLDQRIATAAANRESAPMAYVPGEGIGPPRNPMDLAWSEFNHHWAGLILLVMALLALLERLPALAWARHWPLGLVVLAAMIVVRSDPEVWPLGKVSVLDSLRDPEVAQHRFFEGLTACIGVLEWRTRWLRAADDRLALLFPLLCAVGGAMLLTHSHAVTNVKSQLLIEITHIGLALAVIVSAWSRWIQVRLDGRPARIAAWIWPSALMVAGLILLFYREP